MLHLVGGHLLHLLPLDRLGQRPLFWGTLTSLPAFFMALGVLTGYVFGMLYTIIIFCNEDSVCRDIPLLAPSCILLLYPSSHPHTVHDVLAGHALLLGWKRTIRKSCQIFGFAKRNYCRGGEVINNVFNIFSLNNILFLAAKRYTARATTQETQPKKTLKIKDW